MSNWSDMISDSTQSVPHLELLHREPVGQTVRIVALGDVGLSGRVGHHLHDANLFATVQPLLQSAEIAFANLETPLVHGANAKMLFAADADAALVLKEAGLNLVHLANNHIYDYGVPGMLQSLESLEALGIRSLGVGRDQTAACAPVIWQTGNICIGWIGAGESMSPPQETRLLFHELDAAYLLEQVSTLRDQVDCIIVSLHAGAIYADYPKPGHYNLMHELVDAGAHLVLVHNAHVLQGVEVVNGSHLICHNLGNALFDWQEGHVQSDVMLFEQRTGAVFVFELDEAGVASARAIPLWVDDQMRIQWALGETGAQVLERLKRLSADLSGDYTAKYWTQRADRTSKLMLKALSHHLKSGNWAELRIMANHFRPHHARMLIRSQLRKIVPARKR